jgi:TetR/AcrR family transcriptional regulator, transcriptional repressor for nem operon
MTAAVDLMWDEGYSAVTIDEICARADVRKGSFYYYYKSKSELAVAALERLWTEEWQPRLDREFSAAVEPLDRISHYLEGLHARQSENVRKLGKVLGCPIGSVGNEVSTLEIDVNAKIREIMGRKRRYFESAIRDAVANGSIESCDPVQKAQSIEFLVQGALSQARILNNVELLRDLPATALQMLRPKVAITAGAVQ